MAKKNREQYDWKEQIGIDRKSLYSNGILIESGDMQRKEELLTSRPPIARYKKGEEKWFVLDAWEGLFEIKIDEKGKRIDIKNDKIDTQTYGIKGVLSDVSKMLYSSKKTVLVITNIFKTDDAINAAIRGWSTSDNLRSKDCTVIIFANDKSLFPSEVWSYMKVISPEKSTWDERLGMIDYHYQMTAADDNKYKLTETEQEDAVRLTAGMNLDQLEAALMESTMLKGKIDLVVLARAKRNILASDPAVEIIEQPKFGFEAVGGYDNLKQRIIDNIVMPLRNRDMAERFDIAPPRGILLFGPPGCGKTLLVKSMGKDLNMSIIRILPENIKGKYVGESEKSMRRVFDIADAMSPTIVFLDEFDRFSKRSTGPAATSSPVERELFSMLLEKLGDENRKWFFAAATNLIDQIDPAMMRTGRIDSVAPVPYPDKKARKEIFKIHTKVRRKLPLEKGIDADYIADETAMWSGSDIEQLVIRTTNYAMKEAIKNDDKERKVTMDDFIKILGTFNISIKKNSDLQEKIKEQALEYTNDTRLKDVFEHAAEVKTDRMSKAKELMEEARKQQQEDDEI